MRLKTRLSDIRLTVRLPAELHARLRLFALGRSHGRTVELSEIVREAIERLVALPECQAQPAPMAESSARETR